MLIYRAFLALSTWLCLCTAHSWVERAMKIAFNGTLVGAPGYIRGAVPRTPTFVNHDMQYLLPPNGRCKPSISKSDRICKPTQTIGNYSEDFPKLIVNPGDYIAFQYQENGHVTLPSNTPQKDDSGHVYLYGTQSPSDDDTLLSIHKVWNVEGTGGDRRGRLLAKWPFDDGRCYQRNDGKISKRRQELFSKDDMPPQNGDLWCQADARIPGDIRGDYTIYWVWDWPSSPTDGYPSGQPEIYTSCMEVDIVDSPSLEDMAYEAGQDLNSAAIEDQVMSDIFMR